MTVYVDDVFAPYRGMLMCHMVADTEDELHRMADMIGVDRRWYQRSASTPHYDVAKSKRLLAIGFGAKAITRRELGLWLRAKRIKERGVRIQGEADTHNDLTTVQQQRKEKA